MYFLTKNGIIVSPVGSDLLIGYNDPYKKGTITIGYSDMLFRIFNFGQGLYNLKPQSDTVLWMYDHRLTAPEGYMWSYVQIAQDAVDLLASDGGEYLLSLYVDSNGEWTNFDACERLAGEFNCYVGTFLMRYEFLNKEIERRKTAAKDIALAAAKAAARLEYYHMAEDASPISMPAVKSYVKNGIRYYFVSVRHGTSNDYYNLYTFSPDIAAFGKSRGVYFAYANYYGSSMYSHKDGKYLGQTDMENTSNEVVYTAKFSFPVRDRVIDTVVYERFKCIGTYTVWIGVSRDGFVCKSFGEKRPKLNEDGLLSIVTGGGVILLHLFKIKITI